MRRNNVMTSILAALLVLTLVLPLAGNVSAVAQGAVSQVRVNQVGYPTDGPKRAYLMTSGPVSGNFEVYKSTGGLPVYVAEIGPRQSWWNSNYPYVYALDFDAFTTPGTYYILADGQRSPSFEIGTPAEMYSAMLANVKGHFTNIQRDIHHQNDKSAQVYQQPTYVKDEEKGWVLARDLTPISGVTRDVSGGWYDAGDYVKFVNNISYAVNMMLIPVRDRPDLVGVGTNADFYNEAKWGIDWLKKMWDPNKGTLYYQVGIGSGDGQWETPHDYIAGDHDIWRLPEKDDDYSDPENWYPDKAFKYIRNRPVFIAGPAGAKISPNLAGRLSAAFALCYQVYKDAEPAYANQCLDNAEQIFKLANRDHNDIDPLLTASPHAYYPETEWRDDMELGAVELYYATGDVDYLNDAADWAEQYTKKVDVSNPPYTGTLNLYDVSALAHYELHKAITQAGTSDPNLLTTQAKLEVNLWYQLKVGTTRAQENPFYAGALWNEFDASVHSLGLAATASMYEELTGDATYAAFGQRQMDNVLGSNPWGVSFIIGAGDTDPKYPHNQQTNISSNLKLDGAVLNGPNSMEKINETDPYCFPTMNDCPPSDDPYKDFNQAGNDGAGYIDDVRAWVTGENAIDFTATSILALVHQYKNLALNRPAVASSNSSSAAKAVDGIRGTFWNSNISTADQWLYVDMGNVATINRVVVEWGDHPATIYSVYVTTKDPTNFANWRLAESVMGHGGVDVIDLTSPAVGRYIGLYIEHIPGAGARRYDVAELEVYGGMFGYLLSQGRPATASSYKGSDTPDKAVDGTAAPWISANTGGIDQWIYVDLGTTSTTINQVILYWGNNYPKNYEIWVNATNNPALANWKLGATVINSDGGMDVIPIYANCRYVALYIRNGHSYSLQEMQVFGVQYDE
ncbi:MAG TPA: hypothetical protein ENN19_18415 [Chloroflexi bacterium]|nr:hypothetical protein [Chloroflexota bacterium]